MNTSRIARLLCLTLCVLMLMTGCMQPVINTPQPASAASPNAAPATIHFVDDDGITINLDAPATRIISLYSAHTENLFDLGAGTSVIGGHTTCTYPPEAAFLETFDYTGDPEQVIAAEPDLVLIRPFIRRKAPDYVAELERAGIPVVSLYPESYEAFPAYIEKLAMLTGTEEAAKEKLDAFYQSIEDIREKTSAVSEKQTVFFEATETNIRTVTPDSMPARAIEYAGGINLASDVVPTSEGSTIAEFGVENALAHADDIDVYISQRGAMNSGGNLISIGERPGYDTIKAVRDGRVYLINEKLISSPTFRYYKGIHEVARFLYPELMDDSSAYASDTLADKRDFANMVVRALHLPVYVPASSKYYQTEQKGHIYGLFADVPWTDADFDYIETAVFGGYVEWAAGEDGKEYFLPEEHVTREALAKTVFLVGAFAAQDTHVSIRDIGDCEKPRIVQTLVDNGVFALTDGKFEPGRFVTQQEILDVLALAIQ